MCTEEEREKRKCTPADKLRARSRELEERADASFEGDNVNELVGAVLDLASVTAEAVCVLTEAIERLREDLPSTGSAAPRFVGTSLGEEPR